VQRAFIEDLLQGPTAKRAFEVVVLDSTIARAYQHAPNLTRHTGGSVEKHESAYRAA
jgi:hypothetical protein